VSVEPTQKKAHPPERIGQSAGTKKGPPAGADGPDSFT
jgi:hypothetical protein